MIPLVLVMVVGFATVFVVYYFKELHNKRAAGSARRLRETDPPPSHNLLGGTPRRKGRGRSGAALLPKTGVSGPTVGGGSGYGGVDGV